MSEAAAKMITDMVTTYRISKNADYSMANFAKQFQKTANRIKFMEQRINTMRNEYDNQLDEMAMNYPDLG